MQNLGRRRRRRKMEEVAVGLPEEADVVAGAGEAAGAGQVARLDVLPADLRHDVPLPAQVLVTKAGGR